MDDIEQAAQALIATIKAAIHRLPRTYEAEEQFLAACRRVDDHISSAYYEAIFRRTPEEQERARLIEQARERAKKRARRIELKREAERRVQVQIEELARHKADLFRAHPDHGGSDAAFRKALRRYEKAKRGFIK